MRSGTFDCLRQLRAKYGPGVYGKIAQKLLALAFYEAGFRHVVERGVQGVDIDVASSAEEKYALEVKTTDGESITISNENIEALRERAKDGYVPLIAALRMQLFEDWMFGKIPLGQLRAGSLPLRRLRAYRLRALETLVCPAFEAVVKQHFTAVLSGGEHCLSDLLEQRRKSASST